MAQKIYFNWEDDDSTKDLNHRTLGISEPGRYRGFDVSLMSGLTLRLNHFQTGVSMTMFDSPTHSVERRGVILTKQGVIIQENDELVLPISAGHSTFPRIDLVVCEHEYVEVQGGSNAIYYVIEGTPSASPVHPVVTQPQTKIVLGELYVPAGATDLSNAIYTQSPTPQHANDATIVRTLTNQYVKGQKRFELTTVDHSIAKLDDSAFELDFQGKRANLYEVIANTPSNTYQELETFINLPSSNDGVFKFSLLFRQRTVIYSGAGNIQFQNIVGNSLFIEAGETIEVTDLNGIEATQFTYLIQKNNSTVQSDYLKHKKMVSMSKKTENLPSGVTEISLELKKAANIYEFLPNSSSGYMCRIRYIEGNRIVSSGIGNNDSGTIIHVRFGTLPTVTSGNSCRGVLFHNLGSPPAGYKNIISPTGANVEVKNNAIVTLLEHENYYEIIGVSSPDMNIISLSENAPKRWHNYIPTGGTMENGSIIPLATYPPVPGEMGPRIKLLGDSKVLLGGTAKVSVPPSTPNNGITVLQLPSGYGATYSQNFSIVMMHEGVSGIREPFPAMLGISGSYIYLQLGTIVNIPEGEYWIYFDGIEYSLD